MSQKTKTLVLGGLIVALATVLSFIKVYELPYGGSITLVSMLPIMLYGFLCGPKWGLLAGFTHGVLQLLFGLNALKGVSGWTVFGSILLDYLLAFAVLGLAGMFRGKLQNRALSFTLGALVTGLLRFVCSFLSGVILWGEYADKTFAPVLENMDGTPLVLLYSLLYNGSYMIPEIILTCIAAFLLMQLLGNQLEKLTGQKL